MSLTNGYSFRRLVLYFLRLGTFGFGGPIALVGAMERDLVEDRSWLTPDEYRRGLALSQLAPGPLAAQLAMYIGYIRGGFPGATMVGVVFILPSFAMVVLLGYLYVAFGGLTWMQAVFYGVGSAVIGIIIRSAYKLAKSTLKRVGVLWIIFGLMVLTTVYLERESVWLFLLSGVAAVIVLAPPRLSFSRMRPVLAPAFLTQVPHIPVLTSAPGFLDVFIFFAKAGSFVFGSGLAIVPFLYGSTVEQLHWLTERQFVDAVAVAMITPGPVVITVGFIGYLVAGLKGAVAASMGVFLPVYAVVVLLTPYYERIAAHPQVKAFVDGVTSAATGAIAGAVVVLGRKAISDIPTALIAVSAFVALTRFKVPEPVIVIVAGLIGLLVYHG